MLSTLVLGAALTALCGAPAVAQSSPEPAADKAIIQQLLKKIEQLEVSQQQLRDRIDKMSAPAVAATPAAMAALPAAPAAETQASASAGVVVQAAPEAPAEAESHVLGPVQFRGFGDIDWGNPWFEKLPPGGLTGSTHSFNIGDFDLFTNTRISDHWSLLGEMLITSDFSNGFGVEMDRMMLTYKANDYFKVSFGKFQTALGYYTNNFHRAQYFQTTVGRPIMYSDEDNGGILPTHSIGVTATGLIPSGALGLHWVGEVSNGRSSLLSTEAPIQNFVDDNNGKAVNLQVYMRPEKLRGFQAGFSVYRSTMHPEGIPSVGQTIMTGHVVYEGSKLQWLNEASMLRHTLQNGPETFRSTTGYTQLSWRFGKARPYFRYDYQNIPSGDPIFGTLGRTNGPSLGIMQRMSNYVVLKLQVGRLYVTDKGSSNAVQSQVAFAF